MSRARFHFEIFWPKLDDYEQVVSDAWHGPTSSRGPLSQLNDRLRGLVKALQRWTATKIGGIKEQLLIARELIHRLETAQEARPLTEAEAHSGNE